MKSRFLVFSPFQAIEQHTFPEAFYLKVLREAGHELVVLGCNGLLGEFCIAQSTYDLREHSAAEEKRKVCHHCRISRGAMEKETGAFQLLERWYDRNREAEVVRLVNAVEPKGIASFDFHGVQVGRLASYEFIIHQKIDNISVISPEVMELFRIDLRNALRVLLASEAFLERNKIDKVFLYNSAYGLNAIVRAVAAKQGIPTLFIHHSFNLGHRADSMYFSWNTTCGFDRDTIGGFERKFPDIQLDYSKYPIVLDHLREQLSARSVFTYSSGRTRDVEAVKMKLGLECYKKVFLASMSSFDESYANDFSITNDRYLSGAKRIFPSQVAWIQELIRFFRGHPEAKLIIRVHPREYPNKREAKASPRMQQYLDMFAGLSANIVVDTPDLKNSIYDLFEIVDFHLVSQTTTGLESATLGIPGMAYISGIGNYPIEVIYPVPASAEQYFRRIETAIGEGTGFSLETARAAFDWYLHLQIRATIYHDTKGFWRSAASDRLTSRIFRKAKRVIGLPRFSLRKYLAVTSMRDSEREVFLRMAESVEELLAARDALEPVRNRDEGQFRKYIAGVLDVYFGGKVPESTNFARELQKYITS